MRANFSKLSEQLMSNLNFKEAASELSQAADYLR